MQTYYCDLKMQLANNIFHSNMITMLLQHSYSYHKKRSNCTVRDIMHSGLETTNDSKNMVLNHNTVEIFIVVWFFLDC